MDGSTETSGKRDRGKSIAWADHGALLELTGIARLKEALETNDWEGGDDDELGLEGLDFGEADKEEGFDAEAAEVEREMFEMRRAIYEPGEGQEEEGIADEGEDSKVEELESMMLQMQAIRGMFVNSTWHRYLLYARSGPNHWDCRYGLGYARTGEKEVYR